MSDTSKLTEADQRAVLIALFGIDPDLANKQYVDKAKHHE